jgi:hypothetical protein
MRPPRPPRPGRHAPAEPAAAARVVRRGGALRGPGRQRARRRRTLARLGFAAIGPEHSTGQTEQRVIDVRTGAERRVPVVYDVWWDRGRNLFRAIARVDGRVQSDVSGRPCQTAIGFGRKCLPPKPFDLRHEGYAWLIDRSVARVVGRGVFRGRDVIWVQRLARVRTGSAGRGSPRSPSTPARIGPSGLAPSSAARSTTSRSTGSSGLFQPRRCRSSCRTPRCPAWN